jgi:hypothetical protein
MLRAALALALGFASFGAPGKLPQAPSWMIDQAW